MYKYKELIEVKDLKDEKWVKRSFVGMLGERVIALGGEYESIPDGELEPEMFYIWEEHRPIHIPKLVPYTLETFPSWEYMKVRKKDWDVKAWSTILGVTASEEFQVIAEYTDIKDISFEEGLENWEWITKDGLKPFGVLQ